MEVRHLPIIDWEQAIRVANNKDLAQEILSMLIKQLPKDLANIKQAHEENNFSDLLRLVHKLHGALCYTGALRLKMIISHLETDLKRNIMDNLTPLITQLSQEVTLLLERHTHLPS